jgi:hypothetical protein
MEQKIHGFSFDGEGGAGKACDIKRTCFLEKG